MIDIKELREIGATMDELNELLDRLEAAEKERDELRAAVRHEADCVEAAKAEVDALRAKITEMEQQEPVKHEFQGRYGTWHSFIDQRHYENTVADGTWPIRALYALPGAQPAPSVPIDSIGKRLTQAMDVAVANGANSASMPDELVEVAAWLSGAQPAPSAPEGWQLVPIEPTQEMRNAWTDNMHEAFKVSYRSMIAAAPKPKAKP